MNVDLKRIREAAIGDAPSPAAKRRALSLSAPPVIENPEDDRLEDWMKVVEVSAQEGLASVHVLGGTRVDDGFL